MYCPIRLVYHADKLSDFQDVPNWENNKLDRTLSSRMGWSDISLSLHGPVTQDLRTHFSQRWNFIYDAKYSKKDSRYVRLSATGSGAVAPPAQQREFEEDQAGERGFGGDSYDDQEESGERGLFGRGGRGGGGFKEKIFSRVQEGYEHHYGGRPGSPAQQQSHAEHSSQRARVDCQITRSVSKWSHNVPATEVSKQYPSMESVPNEDSTLFKMPTLRLLGTVSTSYISRINSSLQLLGKSGHQGHALSPIANCHSDQQKPVKNQVGAAIVERIVRAAQNGEKYKMIVMMPSVPAFAGDLKADDALGTRAIMEFQYDSINRGGHSIYEEIARAGFNPMDYIRFFNLRNYDRINVSGAMRAAEEKSGVSYEDARKEHDARDNPEGARGELQEGSRGDYQAYHPPPTSEYGVYELDSSNVQGQGRYEMDSGYGNTQGQGKPADKQYQQQGAAKIGSRQGLGNGRWDSVAECYMLNGKDIREVPWEGGATDEIDAFVSEELYIHSKVSHSCFAYLH
jgi:phospholipase D1/2